jgi:lysozyme family protein
MKGYDTMSARFYQVVTQLTIPAEGGDKFTDFPDDPGGATKYGVTLDALKDWREDNSLTPMDVQDLSEDEAIAIYAVNYWLRINADNLPEGIDSMAFDFGVCSGAATSAKQLQTLLGFAGADVDGWIGLDTIKAISTMPEPTLLSAMHSRQLLFVDSIRNSAAARDRKGWENRVNARYAFSVETPTSGAL